MIRLENSTVVDKIYYEDLNYEMSSVTYWISPVPKPLEIRSLSKTTYVETSSSLLLADDTVDLTQPFKPFTYGVYATKPGDVTVYIYYELF